MASSLLAFALVYLLMVTVVQDRTEEDLAEDLEEFTALMRDDGLERVRDEIRLETQGEAAGDVFFRVWTIDGGEVLTSDLTDWTGLDRPAEVLWRIAESEEPVLQTLVLPEREHGVRSVAGRIGTDHVIQIGESLEDDETFLHALLNGFLMVLAAVVLLGGPVGWFMARCALGGVDEVTRVATEIADGALDQRVVPSSHEDELTRLAKAFNTMLDRIQALILGMREMTDNLAHDLRSPVARMRACAEMALGGKCSTTEWETLAHDTTEECDRLLEMINTTLDIAEAESGAAQLKTTGIDLVAVILAAVDLFQAIAEDKRIEIATDLPEQCLLRGDLERLQRVVSNLLDNALKYTPAGGRVTLGLTDTGDEIRLSITDTGVGISAEDLPRIFQRFYRCDWSRSRFGNGLGLSLALAFVRAHGGDIEVRSAPNKGSAFTVVLPRRHQGGLS